MTLGVGNKTQSEALAQLKRLDLSIEDICVDEYQARIAKAQQLMRQQDIGAMYLNAGTNLAYFSGTRWYASERLVGAILPAEGELEYICPHFEVDTLQGYMQIKGTIYSWQEHESPYQLVMQRLAQIPSRSKVLAIDESTPFFVVDGLAKLSNEFRFVDSKSITASCRMIKSAAEIKLIQTAMNITLATHQAAASILREGISSREVSDFINQAHQVMGTAGSSFCIVLFGQDSAFPHGVKSPKTLAKNDMVLIDTGCKIKGYHSDITRSYVYGKANQRQTQMWNLEKQAQAAAFNAAKIKATCAEVDIAARSYLAQQGLGPEYQLPGLPHRTGHGIGLDIHEWPYLVKNDHTPLAPGMCFSNEPMLVIPGEFGIRLEDHFYMTEQGPKWFTQPSYSIDDPFGLAIEH
ncbi:M24 family metallopeptidase [Aliikangiella sp. IMCC44632]